LTATEDLVALKQGPQSCDEEAISFVSADTSFELNQFCSDHKDMVLDFYCSDHDDICCKSCIADEHRTCGKIKPLDVARQ
jgi:hypothetical protein